MEEIKMRLFIAILFIGFVVGGFISLFIKPTYIGFVLGGFIGAVICAVITYIITSYAVKIQ